MVAAVGDFTYNLIRLVHLLSVTIGAGVLLAEPTLSRHAANTGGVPAREGLEKALRRIVFPALVVGGTAGGALIGLSDGVWSFSQTWLEIAGITWLICLALVIALHPPSYLQLFELKPNQRAVALGLLHLGLSLSLVLMVWKFGAP